MGKKKESKNKSKSAQKKKEKTFFDKHLEYKDDSFRINRLYNRLLDIFKTFSGNQKANHKLQKYKNYNSIKNSLIFLAIEYLVGLGVINTLPYPDYKTVYFAAFASILLFAGYSVYNHIKIFKNKTFMPWLQVVLSALHILVFVALLNQI